MKSERQWRGAQKPAAYAEIRGITQFSGLRAAVRRFRNEDRMWRDSGILT